LVPTVTPQVNAKAKHNCTSLYYASYNGHTLAVRNLLIKGADKNIADEKGRTAVQVACDAPSTTTIKTSVVSLFNIPADKLRA
jgi:ankyrin repeat protein